MSASPNSKSAICRARICSFEEVVRRLVFEEVEGFGERTLAEFEKYDLTRGFWQLCQQRFGYMDETPTLERLTVTLFVTYGKHQIERDFPAPWRTYLSQKSGSVVAFMGEVMNHRLYQERYDRTADRIGQELQVHNVFEKWGAEVLIHSDAFGFADRMIIDWIVERLLREDTGAQLGGYGIDALCEKREKMHFGRRYAQEYAVLKYGFEVVAVADYHCPSAFEEIVDRYLKVDYKVDQHYRLFYTALDRLVGISPYETLRKRVEAIYTHRYLEQLLPKWSAGLMARDMPIHLPLQRHFFERYLGTEKAHTVVIISDALRYEVGQALFDKIQDNPKIKSTFSAQLGVLPSYTRLGMAALLPHEKLTLSEEGKELVDGVYAVDLKSREKILQAAVPDSRCVQFDHIKNLPKEELREVFTGKRVVYVYHDQIDVRGENAEDEVFVACEEAIAEIADLVHRLGSSANVSHVMVTADHGFIYKREKVDESGKIDGVAKGASIVKRRYVVADEPVIDHGIGHLAVGESLDTGDDRVISFPMSTSVFKIPGSGGLNYVHGGASPQEMLIPLIDVRLGKGYVETHSASIVLVSLIKKITHEVTTFDFIQSEAVIDTVKAVRYRFGFESEDGETISNSVLHTVDSREAEAAKRMFKLDFAFKMQPYDLNKAYFLVVRDEATGEVALKHEVIMDLLF